MKTHALITLLIVFSLAISGCGSSASPGNQTPYSDGNSSGTSPQATTVPTTASTTVPTSVPTSAPTTVPTTAPTNGDVKVQIASFSFAPATLEIKVGTTVTWTNEDSASHTVVAEDGSFTSDTLSEGEAFSYTFNKAGTFPYQCGIHARMKGMIKVAP